MFLRFTIFSVITDLVFPKLFLIKQPFKLNLRAKKIKVRKWQFASRNETMVESLVITFVMLGCLLVSNYNVSIINCTKNQSDHLRLHACVRTTDS